MFKSFILYCKHYFNRYKIYKVDDRGYVVKELFMGWIGREVDEIWWGKKYIHHCIVKNCEDANALIEKRKVYLKSINPKIKFAKECYK